MIREIYKVPLKEENTMIFDIETTGLSPLDSRIISIGFSSPFEEDVWMDNNETKLINKFWRMFEKYDFVIVGYNVIFDLRFMRARSLKLGVKVPKRLKYLDLYEIWCKPEYKQKGKLSEVLEHAGIKFKRRTDAMGDSMPDLFVKGDFDEIKRHNADDINATKLLLYRMQACDLI